MSGILSDLRVLDLSRGIAGPMTGMMLGDHGADVIRIEPPGGDWLEEVGRCRLGYRTWHRGKRSIALDFTDDADREVFLALAAHADVLIENYPVGTARKLGVDYDRLSEINPRLIHTSIDGYRDTSNRDRPAYDLLVAARMGLQWEHRSWPETSLYRMAKAPDPFPDFDVDWDLKQGPPREGPLLAGVPTASLGTFYGAISAICAALIARENSGRGQHIQTSMMQGCAYAAQTVWQRAEDYEAPGFATWIYGSKAPKGHFRCADGRWIHQWVPNPRFMLGASAGDTLNATPDLSTRDDPDRLGTAIEETFVVAYYNEQIAPQVAKFDSEEWVKAGAIADIPLQIARPPEEALTDPLFMDYGAVREVDDPVFGPVRQAGRFIEYTVSPSEPSGVAPLPNQHEEEIRAEAAQLASKPRPVPASAAPAAAKPPLDGVRVIDFGLALAGPYGTQTLGDLGADVIKVGAFHDAYWHRNHIAMCCNRSKRSLCIDLKHPGSREVLHRLVAGADIVQHNMRYEAAERLGIDYESLRAVRPDLIYCHTLGFLPGPDEKLPGNEQTGACQAGVEYEDGGMARGGKPIWTMTQYGDTGNGLLSAIGMMNALRHRMRTGEGQFLRTSIVNAQMLNMSHVMARPDGEAMDRWLLDGMQMYFTALYGLYPTADGWLALAVLTEDQWRRLAGVLPDLANEQFADADKRKASDDALRAVLEATFATRPAAEWFALLDKAGVPCEVSDPTYGQNFHDDPEIEAMGLTARFHSPIVGRFDQVGLSYALSDTPVHIPHGPIVLGEGSEAILGQLDYTGAEIEALAADKVVGLWSPGMPMLEGRRLLGAGKAAKENEGAG
ncbi:MAG: CoA transferase [Novosphingobium sp.]|nr:CoA transferase [Novosphingobium sp.]